MLASPFAGDKSYYSFSDNKIPEKFIVISFHGKGFKNG